MDEEKSVLTCNQAIINLKQDFQSNGGTENPDHVTIKHYTRDILLQLRLHPLSLQKPVELPEMDFIKDKLYLDDITDMTSVTPEKQTDASNYQPSVKRDYCNLKPEYTLLSPYFNRTYPYCYSAHGYNGLYQTTPLKHRSTYNNTYCNPLKKHRMTSHQYLKDFCLEECPWAKPFLSSDDIWNCYSNNVHSGCYKKKECIDAVPKCRKKLPIIDPVTGKNVLENIHPNEPNQNSVSFSEENSNAVDNCMNINKFCGDYLCNTKESDNGANINCDSVPFSSPDKTSFEELKDGTDSCFQDYTETKSVKSNIEEPVIDNISSSTDDTSKGAEPENQKEQNSESFGAKNDAFDFNETSEKPYKCDISNCSKQTSKIPHNKEISTHIDVHGACRTHSMKQCHMHVCSENPSKQNDAMQVRQLKEKIYSLKQEEQKITILQSFLRYKKYQLEESVRNLDEKRIEIENWEYNLYNKARRLQEKEQLLENKNELLNNRVQQLAEKEKMLNEEKIKISDVTLYANSSVKTEKKFPFDNNHAIWNEISKMKNPRMDENNEYSFVRCDSKLAKSSEGISPNVEKCKSNAFSLDELEQNLVFIEKMHSSDELIDSSNKIEIVSSLQKNEENASYDPFGYSKGRSYLPERIKYWLDKRDKND